MEVQNNKLIMNLAPNLLVFLFIQMLQIILILRLKVKIMINQKVLMN
jgi:hypothetical protein